MARLLPHRYAQPVSPEREARFVAGHAAAVAKRNRRGLPPLTRVLPRPVRLELGGVVCLVSELRLSDLADLQQWLAEQVPHPCDAVTATDPADRRSQLLAAWEAAKAYPPRFGTPESRTFTLSAGWLVRLLWLALRREAPALTEDEARALATRLSLDEVARLHRVAYGTDAWAEIARELDPDDVTAQPLDWVEAILDLLERHPGWTFTTVADLTISQWRALRCGPEAFTYRNTPREGESLKDARERERRAFAPPSPAGS